MPHLFQYLKNKGLASQVLQPPGSEELVNRLVDLGCGWMATPSGQWVVLDSLRLGGLVGKSGAQVPTDKEDPASWLGTVDTTGQPLIGPITAAVWGFDSV